MSQVQPPLTWGHINVNVSDLEASVEFYRHLGFEIFMPAIPYLDLDQAGGGRLPAEAARGLGVAADDLRRACIMQLGAGFPKLDLTEVSPGKAGPLSNSDVGVVRICLGSSDLKQDYQRLSEAGVVFISKPAMMPNQLASVAVCRDPDGTLIELIEIYLERWAALGGGQGPEEP